MDIYLIVIKYYDWDKEYEKMTEKMKEEDSKIKIPQWLKDLKSNPNLLTPLIKVSIERCKPFENFIEEDKVCLIIYKYMAGTHKT